MLPRCQSFRRWWSRSLPAAVGLQLLVYLGIIYAIHYAIQSVSSELDTDERVKFNKEFNGVVQYFDNGLKGMRREMTFLLGFYVSGKEFL